ncbi:MAG: hypothetical protein WBE72_24305 [Terracidiphilus sp.]
MLSLAEAGRTVWPFVWLGAHQKAAPAFVENRNGRKTTTEHWILKGTVTPW